MHSVLVEYHLDTCTGAITVRHFLVVKVVNNTTIKVILGLLKCKKTYSDSPVTTEKETL